MNYMPNVFRKSKNNRAGDLNILNNYLCLRLRKALVKHTILIFFL